MICGILTRTGVAIVPLIMLAAYGFIFALVILCLVRVARYFRSAGKEQKLIRMELGKVAEEVRLLRQKFEDAKNSDSTSQDG